MTYPGGRLTVRAMIRSVRMLAPLLAAPLLILAACGESKLDSGKLEREIKKGYEAKSGGEATVQRVDCPGDIAGKPGTKSECTARLAGGVQLVFAITVKDDDGNVRWQAVRGTAPGAAFETAAAERLEQIAGVRPSGVDCPARIPLRAGATVRCMVSVADGSTIGSTITIRNPDGDFHIKVDAQ